MQLYLERGDAHYQLGYYLQTEKGRRFGFEEDQRYVECSRDKVILAFVHYKFSLG
jgi:hypothetical protein